MKHIYMFNFNFPSRNSSIYNQNNDARWIAINLFKFWTVFNADRTLSGLLRVRKPPGANCLLELLKKEYK